jgi:N-acetylmuramoyl-L-alanine amidase
MVSTQAAISWLCNPKSKVSAHYLIDEAGQIIQMVEEKNRAWHAGVAYWAGEHDINSCSIGIEIANPGHELGYCEFGDAQMNALENLAADIVRRHAIAPQRLLGHSDVAPERKADPGEKFNWGRLYNAGLGHWVKPEPVGTDSGLAPGDSGRHVLELQQALSGYGYGIKPSGIYDQHCQQVVMAFQRHFRPQRVDGRADYSTIKTLFRLAAGIA